MIRKITYTILALLGFITLKAQLNLVPNGSFEIIDSCPTLISQLHYTRNWYTPTVGTPDLFNTCGESIGNANAPDNDFGFEYPKLGNGYVGIYTYTPNDISNREYIAIKLDTLLEKNKYYCFTMYCSLFDSFYEGYIGEVNDGLDPSYSVFTTSNIGVYFSEDSIFQNSWAPLPYVPQIQNPISNIIDSLTGWKKVEGYFKSVTGQEQYIYIGNFNDNANTQLTMMYEGSNTNPWVYFYIDDISLVECEGVGITENNPEIITIYPNPAQDFVSIDIPENYQKIQLSIYNLTGQLIAQKQITSNQLIPISELGNGMYIFVIQSGHNVIGRQRVVVAR